MPKKRIKIEFTELEFEALVDAVDTVSAAFCEHEAEMENVKLIDRALHRNGYKRKHK